MEIRMAVKVLPNARELEIAQRFVDYETDSAKCGSEDRKWSQDRAGTVKLMDQFYNLTFALKKLDVLVKACLDMKIKPQTMLNYLSIFFGFLLTTVNLRKRQKPWATNMSA